jgi:hypothetical protein
MERNIVKMAIRKPVSYILTGFLVFFIFAGSYHSFCECFSQNCPFHSHANPQKSLWILQSCAFADIDHPDVAPYPVLFEQVIAYPTVFLAPLKARAPPYGSLSADYRATVSGLIVDCG